MHISEIDTVWQDDTAILGSVIHSVARNEVKATIVKVTIKSNHC